MGLKRIIGRWLREKYPYIYKKALLLLYKPDLSKRILRDLKRHPEVYAAPDLSQAVDYIRHNGVAVFPHAFREKYDSFPVEVHKDEDLA